MDIQYDMIGKRIHTRRKELHIKQGELAERIDISNNHLSSIETGKQKPSLETALHLCDALDVTPDYLFLGNMHQDNVSENIIESLKLCSPSDLELLRRIVEIMVDRNADTEYKK